MIAASAVLFIGSGVARAEKRTRAKDEQIRKLPVPPPQPVAQEVSVQRGGQIDIKLRIYGGRTENLRYLIRGGPEQGKLTEPRVVSQESSVVTYRPPADLAVTSDKFLYAVQNTAGVSAPVEVKIKIIDEAAHLVVPETVEFAPLLAGTAAFKEIEISNIGGGLSDGEVKVPAPWRVEGPPTYKLAAGARQKFLIFFEPKEAGVFHGEIRYTSQIDHATTLRGSSEAAIGVEPLELSLEAPSGEAKRAGRLALSNNTETAQELTIRSGKRLHTVATLSIPPGQKADIVVAGDEADLSAIQDQLNISGAGIELKVPVRAATVGGVLKISPEALQFPKVRQGKPASGVVSVENAGGTSGSWKSEAEPPFAAEPGSLHLDPREKREVRVSLLANDLGPVRGLLRFTGEGQTREVRLEAEVVSARGAAAPSTAGASAPPSARAVENGSHQSDLADAANAAAADARLGTLLYLRDNVTVTHITPTAATVEWPSSLGDAKAFRLEARNLGLDDQGHLRTSWQVPQAVRIREDGGRVFAEIHNLLPGSHHTVRVVPVNGGGEAGDALFITQFETLPAKGAGGRITPFSVGVFLLALLALGAFVWQRVRYAKDMGEVQS
jgi:hypothetical protein